MPAFPKPDINYKVVFSKELKNLENYKATKPGREIPKSVAGNLLIATWNLANFGVQKREPAHYKIIAKMLTWFDVIAVQEINDNLDGLRALQAEMPKRFEMMFTDASGNNERMCFIYNSDKVKRLEKVGELAVAAEDLENVKLPGISSVFQGFSRSPFLGTFKAGTFDFALVNVHLYFGDDNEKKSIERRTLETYCVARWADLRRKSKYAFTKNIMALGDFNLPKVEKGDPIYDALVSKGFELPDHTSKIFSNITNDMNYDQVAFMPGIKNRISNGGVFDFDGALFQDLWDPAKPTVLRNYLKYYISDHRPRWYELTL